MPSSPATPSRPRRRSSGVSAYLPRNTSQTSIASPSGGGGAPSRRRSSNTSILSTTAPPRPASAHSTGIALPDLGASLHGENGLGSLADELAEEEWDEDVDAGSEADGGAVADGTGRSAPASPHLEHGRRPSLLSPPIIPESRREYDGSDYGDESDLEEVAGLSTTLEARMAEIEAFARQHTHSSSDAAVVGRVTDYLRSLSSQTDVETGLARLATAHTAQAATLGHQSRMLTSLTQHILSPLAPPLRPDIAADLSEQLAGLLRTLPAPLIVATHAVSSAHALHEVSVDLARQLTQLGDALQMTRHATTGAGRWLRATLDAVATLRQELDEAEAARLYLDQSGCAERLRRKDAATTCRDVVQGFEDVCDSWRARLVQRAATPAQVPLQVQVPVSL